MKKFLKKYYMLLFIIALFFIGYFLRIGYGPLLALLAVSYSLHSYNQSPK